METEDPEHAARGHLMQERENSSERGQHEKQAKFDIYVKRHGLRSDRSKCGAMWREKKKFVVLAACLLIFLVAVAVVVFLLTNLLRDNSPKVDTPIGRLRGREIRTDDGQVVHAFLGVPYARPPTGELRYADPLEYGPLGDVEYDATSMRQSCMQPLDTTFGDFAGSNMWNAPNPLSEDCLFINIWVPATKRHNRTVMVWIYGGGFYSGSNALSVYDGTFLAAYTDVIVASLNYRVGTFGYLSTGDGRIKGNFGMKDQVLALKWINRYVSSFGGDPDSVTVFGESSGASSAGLHLMSAESESLFRYAIFESGSPDSHWSIMSPAQAEQRSAKFFKAVSCDDPGFTSDELFQCLRKLPAQKVLDTEWVTSHFVEFPWAPTIDGDFLKESPYVLLKKGQFQRKKALLGVNRDEGNFWILYHLNSFTRDSPSLQTNEQFTAAIDELMWDISEEKRNEIKVLYRGNHSVMDTAPSAFLRNQVDKVCGDRSFTCPTLELADYIQQNGAQSWFYYLTHRASTESWPDWMGVIHGAEIQWIFGMPLKKSLNYQASEVRFSKTIMGYWANFAKYGDPNAESLPFWPEYADPDRKYLEMQKPDVLVPRQNLRRKYCKFWKRVRAVGSK